MSKHTKGPWVIFEGGITDKEIVITTQERNEAPKVPICEMDVFFDGIVGEEQEANAYLIAAAPELLEALDILCELDENNVYMDEAWRSAFRIARAALAKAKGESK